MHELDIHDFANLFGTSTHNLPPECQKLIAEYNFKYDIIDGEMRENEILHIIKLIDSDLSVSGESRLESWEKGWDENLRLFQSSGYDAQELIPMYYRRGRRVLRMMSNYIIPVYCLH